MIDLSIYDGLPKSVGFGYYAKKYLPTTVEISTLLVG